MTKEKAIDDYRKLTYDLAKTIGKLKFIKDRVSFINQEMEWDGMFEISFAEALEKLAVVQADMVVYSFEDKFRSTDIEELRRTADALESADFDDSDDEDDK